MKHLHLACYILMAVFMNCSPTDDTSISTRADLPGYLIGTFEDDYAIQYSITDSSFILLPNNLYHVLKWDTTQQYLIAQNDSLNTYDPGKWSRIDWITLNNMKPFEWAFCLSVFDAESAEEAESTATVNPETPRTGCNGFPFSRMKRVARNSSNPSIYTN